VYGALHLHRPSLRPSRLERLHVQPRAHQRKTALPARLVQAPRPRANRLTQRRRSAEQASSALLRATGGCDACQPLKALCDAKLLAKLAAHLQALTHQGLRAIFVARVERDKRKRVEGLSLSEHVV